MGAQSKVVNTSGWDPRPWTRPGLGEEQVMEIKDAFDLFDKDRSGEITVGEMLEAMRSLGYDVDGGEAAEHVKNLDRDVGLLRPVSWTGAGATASVKSLLGSLE